MSATGEDKGTLELTVLETKHLKYLVKQVCFYVSGTAIVVPPVCSVCHTAQLSSLAVFFFFYTNLLMLSSIFIFLIKENVPPVKRSLFSILYLLFTN